MQDKIYEQLTELFREIFSNDDLTLRPEMTAKDIEGWDSFTHISVIVAVETKFGIKIKTAEIEKLANVGQLVAAIESRVPAGSLS